MIFRIKIIIVSVIFFATTTGFAQRTEAVFLLPDSAKAFTLENFYFLVLQHHPTAKQANLLSDFAQQEIRLARGNFDPKIELQYLKKNFSDTEYYNILNAQLKFPTVIPIDPSIGVDRNTGTYLNPERYINNEFDYKQLYAGIALPLGQGLLTDERRAALKQAQLFRELTEAEQVKVINKLLLDATKEYWQWYLSYYNFRLLNNGVTVAEEIFRRTKINAQLGEAATIDTIQAKITLQQRLIEQQEALQEFQNSGIRVSTFLWDSLGNPAALNLQWAPVLNEDLFILTQNELLQLAEQAKQNHPELQKINVKLKQLEVDRKLAAEFIKPKLDLSYYFLNQPFDPEFNTNLGLGEDYKFGIDFSFPLFIRKERAKLGQVKLKITNTQWEKSLTERQIINELQATYNTLVNTGIILSQQRDMAINYERLLEAELFNLENGESDLFKINVQQEKLIQSQLKLVKLMSEYEKQKALLYWAAGVRNLNMTRID